MKLNKTTIDRSTYDQSLGNRHVLWDDTVPGFGVRIYPTGRKSFVLSFRSTGRKHLMTIGPYGSFTLQEAKKRALKLIAEVANGKNPLQDRKSKNSGDTIGNLCDDYMKRHSIPNKRTWYDDQQRINDYIKPALGTRKIQNVTRNDLVQLHHKLGDHSKYVANRVISQLSNTFEQAKRWGSLEESAPNPARGIKKFPETKRERWVKVEELPRLINAIKEEQNTSAKAAILMYLLTGARRLELLQLKWSDVDLKRGEICLRETKTNNDHYLPLSKPALNLFRSIAKVKGNPYVFPGNLDGKHLVNITKPWHRIRKKAELDDVRIHDLRRTVDSYMAQNNKSLHLIGSVLNHRNTKTTQIYARFQQDNLRLALEEVGDQILSNSSATLNIEST